jgi:hypothetical protein
MRESSFDTASKRNPDSSKRHGWIPAFAGMTVRSVFAVRLTAAKVIAMRLKVAQVTAVGIAVS